MQTVLQIIDRNVQSLDLAVQILDGFLDDLLQRRDMDTATDRFFSSLAVGDQPGVICQPIINKFLLSNPGVISGKYFVTESGVYLATPAERSL